MPLPAETKPCPQCRGGTMKYSVDPAATQAYEPLLEGGAGQVSDPEPIQPFAYYRCDKCGHRQAADA